MILKIDNIEAIVILHLKKRKKANFCFFLVTKGKKRKGSIVNYRSFAITSTDCGTVQTMLLGAARSHVLARPAARQIFSYKWGAADWGE